MVVLQVKEPCTTFCNTSLLDQCVALSTRCKASAGGGKETTRQPGTDQHSNDHNIPTTVRAEAGAPRPQSRKMRQSAQVGVLVHHALGFHPNLIGTRSVGVPPFGSLICRAAYAVPTR